MHNVIDLTLKFEFGVLGSRHMVVDVSCNDSLIQATPDHAEVTLKNVKLPTQIKIKFSGKIAGKDTIVDANGNIISDMYVKLIDIRMDRLKIPSWAIEKNLSYVTETGKKLTTSYIGFNGEMIIDIPESNGFAFYRRLSKDDNRIPN